MTLRTNFGLNRRHGTLAAMPSPVMVQSAPVHPPAYDGTITTIESKVRDSNELNADVGAETANLNNLLANNKEKTPMCLVNELARYNKIPHQYRLTNEQGPAHRKQFTVTLKLGDEEYTAEGASIKKAQHQAASIALSKTSYKHPPPKPLRSIRLGKNNITPTVELNAWAMKRGELATYHFIAPSNPAIAGPAVNVGPPACPNMGPPVGPMTNYMPIGPPPYNNFTPYSGFRPPFGQVRNQHGGEFIRRNMYRPHFPQYDNQRFYNKAPAAVTGLPPPLFAVMVRVGNREFTGEGPTAQMARHAAAAKALSEIRQLPLPEDKACVAVDNGTLSIKDESGSEIKSPISLVHEVALRRGLTVKFEVTKVTGPPHMRSFHTECTVGEFITEGIGNGKKVSKKRASEKMLDELKKLPPESPCSVSSSTANARTKRKSSQKKKSRNLIKDPKPPTPTNELPPVTTPPEKEEINPISRLIQIQQAKKEQEPVYTLIEERGAPRRREFIMSVRVGSHIHTGTGPNKKLAKRAAAESMLMKLGYSKSSPASTTSKTTNGKERKVVESSSVGGTSGRQLVPGLLLMSDSTYSPPVKGTVMPPTTSTMAKELLQSGKTGTDAQDQQSTPVVRPKDQLLYLATLLSFKVQFSDFPKGNHSEFLSLVSLSTSPPQVCHGAGHSVEASHDQAALTALRMLAEMGLDMFSNNKKESAPASGVDGAQISGQVFNPGKGNTIYEDPKPL